MHGCLLHTTYPVIQCQFQAREFVYIDFRVLRYTVASTFDGGRSCGGPWAWRGLLV